MEGEVIGAAERDVDEWSVSTYDDENDGPSAAATGDLEQEMKQAEEQEDPREKEEENDNEEEIMKSLQELDFELHAHMGKFNDILQKMESASVRDLQKAMKPRKRRKPKSAKKPISVLDLSEGDLSAKKTRKKTKKMKKGKESSDDSAQLQKSVGRKKKKSKTPMKPKHQQPEPDIIVVKVITPNARHGRRKDLEVESNEDMRRRGDYVQSEGESTPQSASQKKLRRKKKKRSKGEEDLDVASPWDRWHQDGRDRIRERRAHDESPLPKRPHSAQPHTSHEFGSKPVWERLYERHSGWPLVPGSPLCPQPAEPSPPHRFCTLRGRSPDKVRRPRPIITPGSPRTAIFDAFREPESPSPRRFIVGASKKERTRKPFDSRLSFDPKESNPAQGFTEREDLVSII
eukprot:TRINITY_DN24482_c0_g1_i1.p1 TRINITY_DN24482_c0_g1~~TRINITY_DN24482_c0_g1_i1.p1  ORF type:complete len:422 (-),score=130.39 TRINITY_DN24482_c0_g1_i1:652-1857(-)